MSRSTPPMRELSRRLIAFEREADKSSNKGARAAFHVCEKLRPNLATLMGSGGFQALLSRALTLAHAEVGWLRSVRVVEDGSLDGLDQLGEQSDPEVMAEASLVLVAQLLGLLEAFIGESLTIGMVSEIWPELSLDD